MEELLDLKDDVAVAALEDELEHDAAVDATSFHFRLEPLREISTDRERQWLIPGLMPSMGLHVLYGAPGTGKSFVALHVGLHVAAGLPWAGKPVQQGGVVYVASEGGRSFRNRVVAARAVLDLPESTPFAIVTQTPRLGGGKHDTRRLIAEIKTQCARLGMTPRLVILDTLSRSITDLRESDSADIMKFVANAQEISEKLQALVMPIHHCGKDEQRGMRGSSALHAAADAEWLVRRDAKTGERSIIVEKMKDGADRGELRYELKPENLGPDVAGAEIITCVAAVTAVVEDEAQPAKAPPTLEVKTEIRVLHGLRMLMALAGKPHSEEGSVPANAKVVAFAQAKKALMAAGLLSSKADTANTGLVRALEALAEKKIAGRDGDLVWLCGEPLPGEPPEAAKKA